jgi:Reeler domain-containing protein
MSRKNIIKVTCLAFFLAALVVELLSNNTVRTVGAFAEGPNPGHTGAPGELTCAVSGCHGGEPNTGPGQFQITAPSSYEPGKTYQITVTHSTSDTSRRRWGFQLTALDGSSNKAGDFQSTSITQVLQGGPGGNRQYIEHNFLGTFQGQPSGAMWTVDWVAPSSDVGRVTFYAAGNQANNNGNESGDQIYATSVSVPVATAINGAPVITGAEVVKKQLLVSGNNFAFEAQLLMDGSKQKKTFNDDVTPNTLLVARKTGKFIAPGQTVVLQVKNPDGTLSNEFSFTRPL